MRECSSSLCVRVCVYFSQPSCHINLRVIFQLHVGNRRVCQKKWCSKSGDFRQLSISQSSECVSLLDLPIFVTHTPLTFFTSLPPATPTGLKTPSCPYSISFDCHSPLPSSFPPSSHSDMNFSSSTSFQHARLGRCQSQSCTRSCSVAQNQKVVQFVPQRLRVQRLPSRVVTVYVLSKQVEESCVRTNPLQRLTSALPNYVFALELSPR